MLYSSINYRHCCGNIIIAVAIEALGLAKVRQIFSNMYTTHYIDLKD